MSKLSTILRLAFLALGALVSAAPALAEALPQPDVLAPNVQFWIRVYTEVDGQGGFIHDAENLGIVYEVVRFESDLSSRARERRVEKVKKRYRDVLRRLTTGKRSGLSAEEARVLELWPQGTRNATFSQASRNLRFQLGQADKFRAGLQRSGRWREYIEGVLKEHDVPLELAALPHVESSYNPKAYSRVGAAGMWQFTRSTGRRYLRVDHVVDERLDPLLSSVAAARLLRDNYRRLEAWPLAITAYNHGAAGMAQAVRRLGTQDIGAIAQRYKSRTFGFASRNFYPSFLAALEVDRKAEWYFGPLHPDEPVSYRNVALDHFYPIDTLVSAFGVDRDLLREHNLALRPSIWNGSKYVPRGYSLRLPEGRYARTVETALSSIPTDQRLSEQHRDRFYKVRRGDTLSKIAKRYRVSERELVSLNNLRSRHRIRSGQVLVLPDDAAGGKSVSVARTKPPADGVYRVRRGDTISSIARRFGVSERALLSLNGVRNRNRISVGQALQLPGIGATQVASNPTPAPKREPTPKPAEPVEQVVAVVQPEAPAVTDATKQSGAETRVARVSVPEPPPEPTLEAEESALVEAIEPESAPELAAGTDDAPELGPVVESPALAALAEPATQTPPAAPSRPDVPSDPSDYSVSSGKRIVVQANETLGHYAEWLELRTNQLRRANGMKYGQPVVIGRRVKLDFSRVTPETFEERRLAYHRSLQEEFFEAYQVTGTETHVLRPGDSLWYLAERKYRVPVWLLRQYNPDLDFAALQAGTKLRVPVIEDRS